MKLEELKEYIASWDRQIVLAVAFVISLVLLLVVALALLRRARRMRPMDMDLLEGHDFEVFCAELLRRRGFQ